MYLKLYSMKKKIENCVGMSSDFCCENDHKSALGRSDNTVKSLNNTIRNGKVCCVGCDVDVSFELQV
jgi:hypothetical protein